jgi:CubicO group peptidase (beta-lactamase class C family)
MTEKPGGHELFRQARERIQQGMVERSIPSLSIAVAQGNTLLWEEGFGWADRERRIVATPHTLYSLASISKPITATAVMILKERGLLDLDQPINDYLGDSKLHAWVGDAKEATVRRVANHTSGLPIHYQFFYQDEPYLRPPMGETIRRYGNLVTAPGERFQYSNLGYGLLSEIVELVSGKSYADFLREEVFLPLGMFHASVNVGHGLEPDQA